MPNTQVLIPTLRSRLVIVGHDALVDEGLRDGLSEAKNFVKKFLAASVAERLLLVKNIVEEKDKGKAIDFVTALEMNLALKINAQNAETLAEILMVKKYLHDRAPSLKLLLEHLCLFVTIPKS